MFVSADGPGSGKEEGGKPFERMLMSDEYLQSAKVNVTVYSIVGGFECESRE